MRLLDLRLLSCCFILALVSSVQAGLYTNHSILGFDLDENGHAIPLKPDQFMLSIDDLKKLTIPDSPELKELLSAISQLEHQEGRSDPETVALAIEMLRLPPSEANTATLARAVNLLQPFTRSPPEALGFIVRTTQGYAHIHRGNPIEAFEQQYSAMRDSMLPTRLLGLSPQQTAWYLRLENGYLLTFYANRKREAKLIEARRLKPGEDEIVDPLFGKGTRPIRFVGASGEFEPGQLDLSERELLPPDAIAIVQQLLMWFPTDGRLWWQLAELYNAAGDLEAAERIYALTVLEIQYSNAELRAHRQAVYQLLAARRDAIAQAEADRKRLLEAAERQRFLMVAAGVIVVVSFVLFWQGREFWRRWKRKNAPRQAS